MEKRNVIITGCSSGIGRCVAEGLKQRGYRVFATARKKTDVDILIAKGFESVQLDLANSASVRSAFATILAKSVRGDINMIIFQMYLLPLYFLSALALV